MSVPRISQRRAVALIFFLNGLLTATVEVCIPRLMTGLGVGSGQIGLALLASSVGAVAAMQIGARLMARLGSRMVCGVFQFALPFIMLVPMAAPGIGTFAAALFVFGCAEGIADVAMNTVAVETERRLERPVMNTVHAAWSIGAIAGALGGSLAGGLDWTPLEQAAVLAGPFAIIAVIATSSLAPPVPRAAGQGESSDMKPVWSRRVILLGLLGTGCEFGESGLGAWSTLYMQMHAGASLVVAPFALMTLTTALTVGRLVGDRLQIKWGPVRLCRTGAVMAACGLAIVIVGTGVPLLLAGFGLVGLGFSTAVPIIVGAVGRIDPHDGKTGGRVTAFSTMTSTGVLSGPPVLGWLGQSVGFGWAFGTLFGVLSGLFAGARLTGENVSAPVSAESVAAQRL